MFITPGTVFSQIFWFLFCFTSVYFLMKNVFIKRVQNILNIRRKKIDSLQSKIDQIMEKTNQIAAENKKIEIDTYEKIRLEKNKLSQEMQEEVAVHMEIIKTNYIEQKIMMENNMKQWKKESIDALNEKLPKITQEIINKIKQ